MNENCNYYKVFLEISSFFNSYSIVDIETFIVVLIKLNYYRERIILIMRLAHRNEVISIDTDFFMTQQPLFDQDIETKVTSNVDKVFDMIG